MVATSESDTQTQPQAPGLASVTEVAKHLGLGRSTVYELMSKGELPFVKIGRSCRVNWADVVRFIETHTQKN